MKRQIKRRVVPSLQMSDSDRALLLFGRAMAAWAKVSAVSAHWTDRVD
jgi:hypothetical protein